MTSTHMMEVPFRKEAQYLGASIVYVKEQMGHSSIQVTVDTYGHLVPGADVSYVDRLDANART